MSQYTHQRAARQYAQEPGRQPVTRAAGGHAWRVTLPRVAGVWLVAVVFFLLFFASAAPSPLYGVYQAQWRFSATTLTAIFATYALLLLVALLVFGSVSDYLGRRRVILVGLALAAGACGLFLAAARAWADTETASVVRLAPWAAAPGATELAQAPDAPEPSTAEVRGWARAAGLDIPGRGKLRPEIWAAWRAAHPG